MLRKTLCVIAAAALSMSVSQADTSDIWQRPAAAPAPAIGEIDQGTQRNVAMAAQAAESTETLRNEARSLTESIAEFTHGDAGENRSAAAAAVAHEDDAHELAA